MKRGKTVIQMKEDDFSDVTDGFFSDHSIVSRQADDDSFLSVPASDCENSSFSCEAPHEFIPITKVADSPSPKAPKSPKSPRRQTGKVSRTPTNAKNPKEMKRHVMTGVFDERTHKVMREDINQNILSKQLNKLMTFTLDGDEKAAEPKSDDELKENKNGSEQKTAAAGSGSVIKNSGSVSSNPVEGLEGSHGSGSSEEEKVPDDDEESGNVGVERVVDNQPIR